MPKQQYNIRIEPSLLEKIRLKALKEDRSVNKCIEIAIEKYCKPVNPLFRKNTVFKAAVSFAKCNNNRDYEDTKASFIGGIHWLKRKIESNES